MKKIYIILFFLFLIPIFWFFSSKTREHFGVPKKIDTSIEKRVETKNLETQSPIVEETSFHEVPANEGKFSDIFNLDKEISESGEIKTSKDEEWWLNSGGYFYAENGVGRTVQGELPENDFWRSLYAKNNPRDTDNGFHPQNIFRLVTRSTWTNFQQESYFRIVADNLSTSSYRNASNGILLFNRYQDGDNLYYTGIRVDGFAVIKKKMKGRYFTMAYNRIFPEKYDRKKKPNLLPHGQWIGLRSEVKNESDGSVSIKVFLDRERKGSWELVAEVKDDGKKYGGKAILDEGYAGIRTDFMDVEFDDYRIEELE